MGNVRTKRNVSITENDHEFLRQLGGGDNVSGGLRTAVVLVRLLHAKYDLFGPDMDKKGLLEELGLPSDGEIPEQDT